MNFRVRLTLTLFAVAAIPLAILGLGVRIEMTARLDADATRRVDAAGVSAIARLAEQHAATRQRLESLAKELAGDNRFRTAITDQASADRRWLLDWAGSRIHLIGFAVLQVQDSAGRVLSSGQFRNDFDRAAPEVQRAIAASPRQPVLYDARTPEGTVRALVASSSFSVRGQQFSLVGGPSTDAAHVAAMSSGAAVSTVLDVGDTPAPNGVFSTIPLPYVNDAGSSITSAARILLVADDTPTRALKAEVTRWLLITLGVTGLVAIIVATLLGGVMSAPVAALAARSARAEATGELARQVNHDIKNGLAPIRNVLRHLAQTAEKDPGALAGIFGERRGTLDSSVAYLDELARNYAKLSPTLSNGPTDPRAVLLAVARGVTTAIVDVRVPDALPSVRVDPLALRRILDNLVSNALDALEGKPGTIALGAEAAGANGDRRVRLTVTDTGRGMSREELAHAFDDFHTTKANGTGLGLTVVRRLLTDVGGSIRADSAPGNGSTFTVELPAS